MRVFTAVVVLVLAVEILLGLGFLAGGYWIGGWQGGLAIAGALLLLILLPWLGELGATYDSAGQLVEAKIGWWGRFSLRRTPKPEMTIRVLGIPWRRRLERRADRAGKTAAGAGKDQEKEEGARVQAPTGVAEPKKPRRRAPWSRVSPENIHDTGRMVFAALAAGNDLIWDAREVHLRVEAPTGQRLPDRIIAQVVGHRGVGPLDIVAGEGASDPEGESRRRIQVRYRIGMFRAGAIALTMVAQGGALRFARSMKRSREQAEKDDRTSDEDRELIEQLRAQLAEKEDESDAGL